MAEVMRLSIKVIASSGINLLKRRDKKEAIIRQVKPRRALFRYKYCPS